MEGSAPQNTPSQTAHHQRASLIRLEQVARLPQLDPQEKQNYENVVRTCWEVLESIPQEEPDYNEAYQTLVRTSQKLMQGMKHYQLAAKQRQSQQQQAVQATQQSVAQGGVTDQQQRNQLDNKGVQFNQLMPEIQQKVNQHTFFYPPAMIKGTRQAEDWLREAKARFGLALQRLQIARSRRAEFKRQAQQRQNSDNPLTPQEMGVFNSKLAQCNKVITDSQTFAESFTAQQNEFRDMPSQQLRKREDQSAVRGDSAGGRMSNLQSGGAAVQAQRPPAHSISSAVSAAVSERNRQPQHQPAVQQGGPSQSEGQAGSLVNPNAASIHRSATGATPSVHAHPLNASIKDTKSVTAQAITKNLQMSEPKPVQMPRARPTLSGGRGAGVLGQLSQPGIVTLPGYVLENSDDGRLSSKKMLNNLVREVVGLEKEGSEVGRWLTPNVEEIFLQIADDFVNDLVSSACQAAKLRGSVALESRDLQIELERQYNIRIPGFHTDEVRTVRRVKPAPGWTEKLRVIEAEKLTGGAKGVTTGRKESLNDVSAYPD